MLSVAFPVNPAIVDSISGDVNDRKTPISQNGRFQVISESTRKAFEHQTWMLGIVLKGLSGVSFLKHS